MALIGEKDLEQEHHRITELFRLEKTFKINKSRHSLTAAELGSVFSSIQ